MEARSVKLLYLISNDARISTKQISRELNISQQTASYNLQNLLTKKIVQKYQTVIDPAKFGFINVFCTYNFKDFTRKTINQLIKTLVEENNIIKLEEISQGGDLLIEYCIPNLSFFNKLHREILHKNKEIISLKETNVVVVKHIYNKKYLTKTTSFDAIVLSGDRDVINLNTNQLEVLKMLKESARTPLTKIASKLNLDSKTIKNIKKTLERKKVIRKYGIQLNHSNSDIKKYYLFLKPDYTNPNELDRILSYTKTHKNVIETTKIIGDFEILITVEEMKESNTLKDIRKNFEIIDYKMIISDKTIKEEFIPDNL